MSCRLKSLGASDRFLREAALYPDLYLGRVVAQHRDYYKVATEKADLLAEISGKLRYASKELPDYPAVGDFVMVDKEETAHEKAIVHHVLSRKSVFLRKAAGKAHQVQVVAANIDRVFICMSFNKDFNLRRLERYLAIAWDSLATPVVVLTKSDLCDNLTEWMAKIEEIAIGVEILTTTSRTVDGHKDLLKYLTEGQTVAFLGSSGVGKSTLINRLLGEDVLITNEIDKDDKGRHTTSWRELIALPSGGAVIDTPGMRELGVETVHLEKTFSELEEFSSNCRFKDCKHENEPGCAVKHAIEKGLITEERLINYNKLKKEAKYERLNFRQIEKEKIDTMFSDFGGIKNAREFIKSKKKR